MKSIKKIAEEVSRKFGKLTKDSVVLTDEDLTSLYAITAKGNPSVEDMLEALTEDPEAIIVLQILENTFLLNEHFRDNPNDDRDKTLFNRLLLLAAACGRYINKIDNKDSGDA